MGHASTAAVLIAMCVASGIFIRGVQQHCRPGLARLGFTIPGIAGPVIAAHLLLCRWAHGAIITGAISLIVSFLMPMKALGMAMNRGPLGEGRADAPMPLLQYLFCYILPISAYHPSTDAGRVVHNRRRLSRAEITFSLVAHALLEAAVVAAVLSPIGAWLPVLVKVRERRL